MASINKILNFGYFLMVVTILIMMWVSWLEATVIVHDIERHQAIQHEYPPCYFNPLCTCSKAIPDLGIVQCRNVPLPRLPLSLNSSKVYMLHLENNGLKYFEPYFLQGTGVYRLYLNHNPLGEIPDGAFAGLERYLWELHLTHNHLIDVPTQSLRYLQKLRLLDLSGNDISIIEPEDWRGLETSLQVLMLSDNSISNLSADTFSGLPLLETIDLRGNNLKFIDPNVFRDGLGHLSKVLLGDNQLTEIPYLALSSLPLLRYLDLSQNNIELIYSVELTIPLLSLETFRLDYNLIEVVHPGSFQLFTQVNKTFLDGNPINSLEDNAFRNAKIMELSLRNCKLTHISPTAFNGLEGTLQSLDLSGNNLTGIPKDMFTHFQVLSTLFLRDNFISIKPLEDFNGFQYSLLNLDLSGKEMSTTKLQELRKLRNLRNLKLPKLIISQLTPEDFQEFGANLEQLTLTGVKGIKNNAFRHVRGLKLLDLSENLIETLEPGCFLELGHSLIELKLGHGLSSKIQVLPVEVLQSLRNLQYLDLGNNHLTTMSDTSFHFLRNLRRVELQDNKIQDVVKGTFQGDIHGDLQEIYLSFNFIKSIQQHTFVDLSSLQVLYLDDNRIETIERRAFMNLDRLQFLTLRGNKIQEIMEEAFQNLPELNYLDLAYNHLTKFSFDILDQVGSLAPFRLNISHNKISELRTNFSTFNGDVNAFYGPAIHSNIKILDLAFNNISFISRAFFRPAEISLTHLHLSHNQITNISREVFGSITHLQWLDLSWNRIRELGRDAFKNTRKLQVFIASNNQLEGLYSEIFQGLSELRVVDLSNNLLRGLPDHLLNEGTLEKLDLSDNQLSKMPLTSLSNNVAQNLCELDLSGNLIQNIGYPELFNRFKSLLWLDLSNNQLIRIERSAFSHLPKLVHLDLSNNQNLDLADDGRSFRGLERSLMELKLDNVSLVQFAELPFHRLRLLSISRNELPTVPPELAPNMSSLRHLDLSYNDLTAVPLIMVSLTQLRYLSLAGNPITTLSNTSLLGVSEHLQELDLQNTTITKIDSGVLSKMSALRRLHLSVKKNIPNFNIPKVLSGAHGLRDLRLEVADETNLATEMMGKFPNKLTDISFRGKKLKSLDNSILKGIQSPVLNINIQDTSLNNINSQIFQGIDTVRNITLTIQNKGTISYVDNPSTGSKPNLPRDTFLTGLSISGNGFKCDCQIGWIEVWERKKRQYLCQDVPKTEDCRLASDDLRNIVCGNKGNSSLIDVLKSDIECGWGSVGTFQKITPHVLISIAILLRIL